MKQNIFILLANDQDPCWNIEKMQFVQYNSDYKKIREYAKYVMEYALDENYQDIKVLEEQITELIKNAIIHGNDCFLEKKVKIYFLFEKKLAKIIVEDEGEGFQGIEKWNRFNRKREKIFHDDKAPMNLKIKYLAYKEEDKEGDKEEELKNGNHLFSAVSYWNQGFFFSQKRNKVCAIRKMY